MSTGTRALELLGLLQSRRHWPSGELARRLGVSQRTLRRAVDDLRELGYPIASARGTGGGYQLSPGGSLPPLALSEEEAAVVIMGLKEIASSPSPIFGDAAISAMAKIVQVLPVRIRHRVDSLRIVALAPGGDPGSRLTDVVALTTVALACRDHEALRFAYRARDGEISQRHVHPHRTVSADSRLYLIAWDLDRADWRTFRVDRIGDPTRTRQKFGARRLPCTDPVEYVRAQIGSVPARYPIRAVVHAPAARVRQEIAHYGVVDAIDETSCSVYIPAESLDWATFCLGAIGAPLVIEGPPEAVQHMRRWGRRLVAGTDDAAQRERPG